MSGGRTAGGGRSGAGHASSRSRASSAGRKTAPTPVRDSSGGTRLNKVLADAGVASRRAADELIAAGRVKVNGMVVTELGLRVDPRDRVMLDGQLVGDAERLVYYILNKPKDTITTTSDERGRRTVLDLVHTHERIYPVGRLDRNTTGVLILTNDGDLANRLMHPRYGVPRLYEVMLDRPLDLHHAKEIVQGVVLEGGEQTQPCELDVDARDRHSLAILLHEGKNREVRRIFEHFGYEVTRLDRKQYAGLTARGLARGEWRRLDRREISMLRRMVNLE